MNPFNKTAVNVGTLFFATLDHGIKITEKRQDARLPKDAQIEQAVVRFRLRGDWQAESVLGKIENKSHCALQPLAGIGYLHIKRWESIIVERLQNGPDIAKLVNMAEAVAMASMHHFGIEAYAGH